MAIARTNAHRMRMIGEIETGILNMQDSFNNAAQVWKNHASSESVPLVALQQYITDYLSSVNSIRAKMRNARDVILPGDAEFSTLISQKSGMSVLELDTLGQSITIHIDAFAAMPVTTYAEIIAACDYVLANVNKPESIWD